MFKSVKGLFMGAKTMGGATSAAVPDRRVWAKRPSKITIQISWAIYFLDKFGNH
jgi:hypothetical protein